jgi:ribosomal-protein-alanine N-acetyltransferase
MGVSKAKGLALLAETPALARYRTQCGASVLRAFGTQPDRRKFLRNSMSSDGLIYKVEAMQWADVPAVMAIEHQSFTLPWSDFTYRRELLENVHSHYFVVHRINHAPAQRLSWFARLRLRHKEPAPVVSYGGFWLIADEAHISTIASHPDWRGRGLGELMLLVMIERAIDLQANMVTLEVRVTNEVAQTLYRKYGFEFVGRRVRYYRDNDEDADLMTVEGVQQPAYRQKLQALRAALEDQLRREAVRANGRTES